jgi:hypothetical protein
MIYLKKFNENSHVLFQEINFAEISIAKEKNVPLSKNDLGLIKNELKKIEKILPKLHVFFDDNVVCFDFQFLILRGEKNKLDKSHLSLIIFKDNDEYFYLHKTVKYNPNYKGSKKNNSVPSTRVLDVESCSVKCDSNEGLKEYFDTLYIDIKTKLGI